MSKEKEDSGSDLVALLGPTLLTDTKGGSKDTATLLKDKDLVFLYFSASWCPPCRSFSPLLKQFYGFVNKENVEIVYVSSDKNLTDFKDYYGTMPWLAIPTDAGSAQIKNQLAQKLQIRGIPSLVVLDKSGKFVTDQARTDVTNVANDATKSVELVKQYKLQEAVPLDQAVLGQTPPMQFSLQALVQAILRNPMALFALFYIGKWIWRQIQAYRAAQGLEHGDKEL